MTDGRKKPRRRKKAGNLPRISEDISAMRMSLGLTQEYAAQKLGISAMTLSRLERGDLRISAKGLEKILNFFDATLGSVPLNASQAPQRGDSYEEW